MTAAVPPRPRPAHVPVLTEVIDIRSPDVTGAGAAEPTPPPEAFQPPPQWPSEQQIAQKVMQDVQRQLDGMLDFRLREAMAPLLARHADALVQDLREELSRTLRDVVQRAVSQELAKLRQR